MADEEHDLKHIFGANLREQRQRQRLTREQLAAAAGCTDTAIKKIESGANAPSFSMLAKLSKGLSVAPAVLFGGAGETRDGVDSSVIWSNLMLLSKRDFAFFAEAIGLYAEKEIEKK